MRGRLRSGLLLALLAVTSAAPVGAHELSREQLSGVGFDQHLGGTLPLDLGFRDESGQPVTLASYFGQRPVVLTLNYLHCPNLCPIELEGLVNGLNGLPFSMGDQFTLLTVSIDPRETPEQAATAKARGLRGYARSGGAGGWHVLTGQQDAIDRLTRAVGFTYVYDAQEDEYVHPAGVVVLTPTGRISRYLYGIDFSATDLRLALVEAAAQRIGSIVDQVLLVCYHYDPVTGRYTPLVLDLLKVSGAATVLVVAGVIGWLWRSDRAARAAG